LDSIYIIYNQHLYRKLKRFQRMSVVKIIMKLMIIQ